MIDRINQRLGELIPRNTTPLYEAARYSLLSSGKRLRPSLVLASAAAFGADPKVALDPACAIEMVHTYSLIHDDLPCMDDDDLRRGRPTLHKVFSEGIALLAGDYLLTYSFEVISNTAVLSAEEKLRLIQILSLSAGDQGMIGGQAIDIGLAGTTIDEACLQKIHRGKTGALLSAALQFGAIIGKAPTSTLSDLSNLGYQIGIAFQFLDDLLDATSSKEILGKNVKRDAILNKPTAVAFYGIEGVENKLQQFQISITQQLNQLPKDTSLITDLLHRHLWARKPLKH